MPLEKARSPIEWRENGTTPEGARNFTIMTTVNRVTSDLQRTLQFSLDAARVLLHHLAANPNQDPPPFADAFLHFEPAQNRRMTGTELGTEARRWVLRNGFRDAVEAVHSVLDNTRDLLAVWSLKGVITGADWNARMNEEREKFGWKGPEAKLDLLSSRFGFTIPADWRELILSIVQARNCLVHREGIVGEPDLNETGNLVVRWVRLRPFAGTEKNMREAKPNEWMGPGETLAMVRHPASKSFPRGAAVDFTAEEFQDICYALVQFGRTVQALLERYRKDNGIP